MIYVVGSGPAGVSAAMALVAQGLEVTMLDAGLALEPERQRLVGEMSGQDPAQWQAASLAAIKGNMSSGKSGIPLKYVYGSDFPYQEAHRLLPREGDRIGLLPSFARGGFSNVWGSAVLPYLDEELAAWPLRPGELAPHYAAVLSFMGVSAVKDDLAERFPLFTEEPQSLPISRQAEELLRDLDAGRDELRRRGFLFGRSRLAVRPDPASGRACVACGLCMYGCPYGLIYSTNDTLAKLTAQPRFTYRGGLAVERVREADGGVVVGARELATGESVELHGERVYLAAGVLGSTRIVLESLGAYDQAVTLRDSQYFLLPYLRYRGVSRASGESLHTLAQMFLEIFDPEVSPASVHLQVYTYNDMYRDAVKAVLGPGFPLFRPMLDAFLNRFLVIQGYLHSDLSSSVAVTLRRSGALHLRAQPNPLTRKALRRVTGKLAASRSLLRAVPMSPMLKAGEPGRGFHSGGTLPMSHQPAQFETDRWGRPSGLDKVHVVDSSVFPSINASTITLTVMANAHRIAAGGSY